MAFLDLTRALYTDERDNWNILCTCGCPPTFVAILLQLHTDMCAQVVMAVFQIPTLTVDVRVKQGCVLAPIIFNIILVAITLESHDDHQPSDSVRAEYPLDGSLLNLMRLQAKAKISSAPILARQNAENAVFPSLST